MRAGARVLRRTAALAALGAALAAAPAAEPPPPESEPDEKEGARFQADGELGLACAFTGPLLQEIRVYWRDPQLGAESYPDWSPLLACRESHEERRSLRGEYLVTAWHARCASCDWAQSRLEKEKSDARRFRFRASSAEPSTAVFTLDGRPAP